MKSNIISYRHDIEAAWLVKEAAEIITDEPALPTGKAGYRTRRQIIEKVKQDSVLIETASEEGLDKDGGLWHEFDVDKSHLVKEKHWWPQQKR